MNALDRLLSRPRATSVVTIAYDPDRAASLAEARARRLVEGADADLDERIAELEGSLETITFSLRGVGVAKVDEIIEEHIDDKGQPGPRFLPALLAATCWQIVVSMDPDEPITEVVPEVMAKILDRCALADQERLSAAALALDRRSATVED